MKRSFLLFTVLLHASVAMGATCGLQGSASERIKDCQNAFGSKSTKTFPGGSELAPASVWKLFAYTENGREIWYNENTKILWSARLEEAVPLTEDFAQSCEDPKRETEAKGNFAVVWHIPARAAWEKGLSFGLDKITPENSLERPPEGFLAGDPTHKRTTIFNLLRSEWWVPKYRFGSGFHTDYSGESLLAGSRTKTPSVFIRCIYTGWAKEK